MLHGESIESGEINEVKSGNTEIDMDEFNALVASLSGVDEAKLDNDIKKNITMIVVVATVILFLNFLIIYLIFKSKWNKIIKSLLIIVFVLVALAIVFGLCFGHYYMEELIKLYKIYYIFK